VNYLFHQLSNYLARFQLCHLLRVVAVVKLALMSLQPYFPSKDYDLSDPGCQAAGMSFRVSSLWLLMFFSSIPAVVAAY